MEFRDKLSLLRRDKGLSQEKLAEELGISRQAVAKWELGQGYPDIGNLIRLSELFKISVDRLIKPEDDHYFISCRRKDQLQENEVINFLCKAKKSTYAANAGFTESSRPNSHDLSFQEGQYRYLDTYLGGERFAGEEAVWQQESPIWSMNYLGRVTETCFSGDFLKEALLLVTPESPFRGPALHHNGDYIYICNVTGDFTWFQGYEEIFCKATRIYECYFHGGALK